MDNTRILTSLAEKVFVKEGVTLRALLPEEQKYTFKQSRQIAVQTGFIGYSKFEWLNVGSTLYSVLWNSEPETKVITDDFYHEYGELVDCLRQEGNFLHSVSNMQEFCNVFADEISFYDKRNFGVRIDTKERTYLIRFTPKSPQNNVFCFCYLKDWLDGHIEKAKRGIRFFNADYVTMFTATDGDDVVITTKDGEIMERQCRYIDDYHLQIGCNIYHICEFADINERCGNQLKPKRVAS